MNFGALTSLECVDPSECQSPVFDGTESDCSSNYAIQLDSVECRALHSLVSYHKYSVTDSIPPKYGCINLDLVEIEKIKEIHLEREN